MNEDADFTDPFPDTQFEDPFPDTEELFEPLAYPKLSDKEISLLAECVARGMVGEMLITRHCSD